jgi:hypothetical protein
VSSSDKKDDKSAQPNVGNPGDATS